MGNLTEKQAQNALAGKFNKSKNQQENQIENQGGKSEKKPKMSKFSQKLAQYALALSWNCKSAIIFGKKAICKTEILKKQAKKTSKFQLKQAQKQATRKSSKKPRNSTKKQAQIRGKNARLATLMPQ